MVTKRMARNYEMRARADAVQARRERILEVAYELFIERGYDDITLDAIASGAGVSLKTVTRQFKSKDDLLLESCKVGVVIEARHREVAPGDVDGVVRALSRRYDSMLDLVPRMAVLEERLDAAATARQAGIEAHTAWLAEAFSPWVPATGSQRRTRLMALYGATELYVWWMWRRRLGLTRAAAATAMRELLDALVARWTEDGGAK